MLNSLGQPDTILLLGGSSDIAVAIAARLLGDRRLQVVLAARPTARRDAVKAQLTDLGADVELVDFDATDVSHAVEVLDAVFDQHEVDIAVVAHGVLPDQAQLESDPAAAAELCTVNYGSAVATGLLLARRMTIQRHGVIVTLSSVAGVRPRRGNFVYGSTKAGLDAFYTGLRERLRGTGVRVLVVRPGFVRTAMTAGLPPAPLATVPEHVADRVCAAVASGNGALWVPAVLGPVMTVLRLLPGPVFRRIAG